MVKFSKYLIIVLAFLLSSNFSADAKKRKTTQKKAATQSLNYSDSIPDVFNLAAFMNVVKRNGEKLNSISDPESGLTLSTYKYRILDFENVIFRYCTLKSDGVTTRVLTFQIPINDYEAGLDALFKVKNAFVKKYGEPTIENASIDDLGNYYWNIYKKSKGSAKFMCQLKTNDSEVEDYGDSKYIINVAITKE